MKHRLERVVVRQATLRDRQHRSSMGGLGSFALVAVLVIATLGISAAHTQLLAIAAPSARASGGAPGGTAEELRLAAATLLEQSTAPGGSGYRFEIVQRSTIQARPGGPKLPIPNPDDPKGEPIGETDAEYFLGLTESGFVTSSGFSMEMRSGPSSADVPADAKAGTVLFRALALGKAVFRDDGRGWYAADVPPGIGLDPATAALLPTFLRDATGVRDAALETAQGELGRADAQATRALIASVEVADIPGVIAVDAASFTELLGPVALTFDAAGRIVGIVATARNTRMETYDLVVVTEIAIRYDDVPTDLPDASPMWDGILSKTSDQ